MAKAWICVRIGSAACRKIIHLAPWMIGAYLAVHPLPTDCRDHRCHFVIPQREFLPGGMFGTHPARPFRPPPSAFSLAPLTFGTDGLPPPRLLLIPAISTTPSLPTSVGGGGGPPAVPDRPPQNVPEPSSAWLLGVGALAVLLRRRRGRAA